jgi:hypothetical protein
VFERVIFLKGCEIATHRDRQKSKHTIFGTHGVAGVAADDAEQVAGQAE